MNFLLYGVIGATGSLGDGGTGPGLEELHRYWRINFLNDGVGSGYVWFSEISYSDYIDGADLSPLAVNTAEQENVTNNYLRAFDGNTSTYYRTNTASPTYPVRVKMDFGTDGLQQINEVRITSFSTNDVEAPLWFTVEFSDDNINWTESWTGDLRSGGAYVGTETKVFRSPSAPANPYVDALRLDSASQKLVLGEPHDLKTKMAVTAVHVVYTE